MAVEERDQSDKSERLVSQSVQDSKATRDANDVVSERSTHVYRSRSAASQVLGAENLMWIVGHSLDADSLKKVLHVNSSFNRLLGPVRYKHIELATPEVIRHFITSWSPSHKSMSTIRRTTSHRLPYHARSVQSLALDHYDEVGISGLNTLFDDQITTVSISVSRQSREQRLHIPSGPISSLRIFRPQHVSISLGDLHYQTWTSDPWSPVELFSTSIEDWQGLLELPKALEKLPFTPKTVRLALSDEKWQTWVGLMENQYQAALAYTASAGSIIRSLVCLRNLDRYLFQVYLAAGIVLSESDVWYREDLGSDAADRPPESSRVGMSLADHVLAATAARSFTKSFEFLTLDELKARGNFAAREIEHAEKVQAKVRALEEKTDLRGTEGLWGTWTVTKRK